jgi:hypothetical protein
MIRNAIQVMNDGDFNREHFRMGVAMNPMLAQDALGIRDARRVTQVEGFQHGGRIVLRQGLVNAHIAVHESLHMLSHGGLAAAVGPVLNEALTETLALAVCVHAGIGTTNYYQGERHFLTQISNVRHWNMDFYKRAYFDDPSLISDQLIAQMGNDGYVHFLTQKSGPDALQAYNQGSTRQRKRVNLRTEVLSGLTAYGRRWKFNISDASAHALGRLNALIDRLDILEGIMRYYLEPVTLAPGGGFNLGAKLDQGSSLRTDLNTAFTRWALANP